MFAGLAQDQPSATLSPSPSPAASVSPSPSASPAQLPSQAKPVDRVLVPVPKEVFNLLDQFHNANWRAVERPQITEWKSHGDQVQVALLLGTVVAEGFVAMEAEDSAEVRKLGNRALAFSRGLGVERNALRRSRAIMDRADANDWPAARREWDGVLADLEKGMIGLQSESLAHLVSLSGWLRGTDALCVLVLQDYSPEHAEVIRQPGIVDYLEQQIDEMKPGMRNHPMVKKLQTGLRRIRELLGPEGMPLTADNVKEIGKVCDGLVKVSSHRRDGKD
jgi:hypothetical protein